MVTAYISSVQNQQGGGYLLNGTMSVPEAPGNSHYILIQKWIEEGNVPEPAPTISLGQAKEEKLQEIRAASDREINKLTAAYSDGEKGSWPNQEKEALAYQADNTSSTPLLTAIATARGIDFDELVDKVLTNATMFSIASGQILGKQQKLEDLVNNAESADIISGIVWE